MSKKIKLIVLSIISAILLTVAILFLIMQYQPIIKNQKYTLIQSGDGQRYSIAFDKNNQCHICEETKDYISSYSRSYYQKGKYIDISLQGKAYKNDNIENFQNGLLLVRIYSGSMVNQQEYTFLKPLWYLSASLICFILAIISVYFLLWRAYKEYDMAKFKQKLKETDGNA